MVLKLYALLNCNKNVLNKLKTTNINRTVTLNGNLIYPTDIKTPQIRILVTNESNLTFSDLVEYNYAYIEDFNRWYFVENITVFKDNLLDFYFKVDVCGGFEEKVLTSQQFIVERTSVNAFVNQLVKDDYIQLDTTKKYREIIVPPTIQGTTLDVFKLAPYGESFNYLFSATSNDIINLYPQPESSTVVSGIYENNYVNNAFVFNTPTYELNRECVENILSAVANDQTLASYIKFLKHYPFSFKYDSTQYPFINGLKVKETFIQFTPSRSSYACYVTDTRVLADFNFNDLLIGENDRLDLNYINYDLWLPYYGFFSLDPVLCKDRRITVKYVTRLNDGSSEVFVVLGQGYYEDERPTILLHESVTLGYDVPYSYDNTKQKNDEALAKETQSTIAAIGTTIGAIAMTVLSEGTMLPVSAVAVAGSLGALGGTVASSEFMKKYTENTTKLTSSNLGTNDIQYCYVVRTSNDLLVRYNESIFAETYGYPSTTIINKTQLLANAGYYKLSVSKFMKNNTSYSMTTEEINELIEKLYNGVVVI